LIGEDEGEARAEQAIKAACEEQGVAKPARGDLVAVGAWNSPNETMQAKAAEVVSDRAGFDVPALERFEPRSQIAVGKAVGEETEEDQRVQQGMDPLVFKPQGGGALGIDHPCSLDGVKALLADRAIVADSLDVE